MRARRRHGDRTEDQRELRSRPSIKDGVQHNGLHLDLRFVEALNTNRAVERVGVERRRAEYPIPSA